ncbi:MAG TPA: hypothetical protein VK745_20400, partial [Polyangiaceae bacterium]|nr:hypothetical protein [Polyangiaceae bacterium]
TSGTGGKGGTSGTGGSLGTGGKGGAGAGGGGASSTGGAGSGGMGGGVSTGPCNAITQRGTSVSATEGTGAAPTASHGTIVAGTYVQTSVVAYGLPTTEFTSGSSTLEISVSGGNATIQELDSAPIETPASDVTSTQHLNPGTPTAFFFSCEYPDPGQVLNTDLAVDYTATATTFVLYYTLGTNMYAVSTFTKL